MEILVVVIVLLVLIEFCLPFRLPVIGGPAIGRNSAVVASLLVQNGRPVRAFGPGEFFSAPLLFSQIYPYEIFNIPYANEPGEIEGGDEDTAILTLPCKGGAELRLHVTYMTRVAYDDKLPPNARENFEILVKAWKSNKYHDPSRNLDDVMQNALTSALMERTVEEWVGISGRRGRKATTLKAITSIVQKALGEEAGKLGCATWFLLKDYDPPAEFKQAVVNAFTIDTTTAADVRRMRALNQALVSNYRDQKAAMGGDLNFQTAWRVMGETFKNVQTLFMPGGIGGSGDNWLTGLGLNSLGDDKDKKGVDK